MRAYNVIMTVRVSKTPSLDGNNGLYFVWRMTETKRNVNIDSRRYTCQRGRVESSGLSTYVSYFYWIPHATAIPV
jgi:hypothetical protein